MMLHDLHRFAACIDKFIDDSGIAPPFHLVAISANSSISVLQHGDGSIDEERPFLFEFNNLAL